MEFFSSAWGVALAVALGAIVALGLFSVVFLIFFPGVIVYRILLVRTKPEKWSRYYEGDSDDELRQLHVEGMEWGKRYDACRSDVFVKNDGLRLAGQYFDFGRKRAVIIVPGRMEASYYCMYYAEPYRAAGYNVLVIDNRAHGESEGKYNTAGFKEFRDVLQWARMLHDDLGNEAVVLHGVCVGSATCLYAVTDEACPEYVVGMAADGMYTTFRESLVNHILERKKKVWPAVPMIMRRLSKRAGVNASEVGPITYIEKMRKPILFLHSKVDEYSFAEKAQQLYDLCPSEKKRIVWFETGRHSRVRMYNTAAYDEAVVQFTQEFYDEK